MSLFSELTRLYRISPRRSPSPPDSRHNEREEEKQEEKLREKAHSPPPPPIVDMEIDLPHSPPPVEDVLAARRAKREAIRLKHLGINSVNTSVSPSPGPSSAVQPLPSRLHVSNLVSQNSHSEQTPEPHTGSEGLSAQSGEYMSPVRSALLMILFW
jgi:serine/threonine-protein kinase PRP4